MLKGLPRVTYATATPEERDIHFTDIRDGKRYEWRGEYYCEGCDLHYTVPNWQTRQFWQMPKCPQCGERQMICHAFERVA